MGAFADCPRRQGPGIWPHLPPQPHLPRWAVPGCDKHSAGGWHCRSCLRRDARPGPQQRPRLISTEPPPRPAAPCPSARREAHIGPLTLSLAVTHAHANGRRAVSPHTAAAQGLGLFRGVEIAGSPLHKESDPVLLPHSGVTQLNQICHRVPKRAKCPSRSVSECGRGSVRVRAHVPVCARVCTCVRADACPGPALRRAADWLRVSF